MLTTRTQNSEASPGPDLFSPPTGNTARFESEFSPAIEFAADLARRYHLSSLAPLLASCRAAASEHEVSVAVVGRFKAGKSSFLNHFTNRSILPVGVVPVTAVVTEIRFGPTERAVVHFRNGGVEEVPVDSVSRYVSERENPENFKGVRLVAVELPGLERFRGLKFVDTPGLESALLHNTEESVRWLPNAGLALVAVSVDPPLSQQDIELLGRLYRFTPNVTVLLTKVDLLSPGDRAEVIAFINQQLRRAFEKAPQVVLYSVRPGYEELRTALEQTVLQPVLARFNQERGAIVQRKVDTLLAECSGYVTLSLKSGELADAQRKALKEQLVGRQKVIADVKSQLRLIAHHAAAGTRTFVESRLQSHQRDIEKNLLTDLAIEFPKWTKSLAVLIDSFDRWLRFSLGQNLAAASANERTGLMEPLRRTSGQVVRILQDFRDRLSEGTMQAFGVPLRTTEVEMEVREPEAPDCYVGKIFDTNWELLSPIVPVMLIRRLVRRHFEAQVSYKLFINISRVASQWEERINSALLELEGDAERRLDELVDTVGRLLESRGADRVSAIREDLQKIESLRGEMAGTTHGSAPDSANTQTP
jgi:GTP-binding protein EngB required for normal cell division